MGPWRHPWWQRHRGENQPRRESPLISSRAEAPLQQEALQRGSAILHLPLADTMEDTVQTSSPCRPPRRPPTDSLSRVLFLIVVISMLTTHIADAARVMLRTYPGAREFQERQEIPSTVRVDKEPDFKLDSLHDLQDTADTLDILVPLSIWGLQNIVDEHEETEMQLSPSERISLPSLPSILPHFNTSCSCQHWKCSCCARVEVLRKNKTGCGSLFYNRERLAVVLELAFNNRTLIERDLISGSNPPPVCFPIPQLPIITVCVRLSNISFTNDAKVQACAAVELGLVFTSPLIRLRFGCLKIGQGGISWSGTPATNTINLHSVEDAESAFQQFAAALNNTDNQQFQLLQSILRQQDFYEKPSTMLPSRNQKMAWPLAQ